MDTFRIALDRIHPCQLYLSSDKLAVIRRRWAAEGEASLPPLPLMQLGDEIVFADGHHRAFVALERGVREIQAYWDVDDEDRTIYKIATDWCRQSAIRSVGDLAGRALAADDYADAWAARCKAIEHWLLGSPGWCAHHSTHYTFHYRAGSLAEQRIEDIARLQEECYHRIIRVLQIKPQMPIAYYLCETMEETSRLSLRQDEASGVEVHPDCVFAVYNDDVQCIGIHEDAHLLAFQAMGYPYSDFLREALAMFLDSVWWGLPNEAWVQCLARRGLCPSVAKLMDNQNMRSLSSLTTYPLAGVFARYLVDTAGIDGFKELYRGANDGLEAALQSSLGLTLQEIDYKLIRYAGTIGYSYSIIRTIDKHLDTHTSREPHSR